MSVYVLPNILENCIELHYYTENGGHEMDAFSLTKCSTQILNIIVAFCKELKVDVKVDTIAYGEGGIKQWLKIVKEQEDKTAPITTEVIKYLIVSAMGVLGFFGHELYQYIREDKELTALKKEAIIKYLSDSDFKSSEKLDNKVTKLRSNYYDSISKANNVTSVSFSSIGNWGEVSYVKDVSRSSFPLFILSDNTLDPIDVEDATIVITSPIITKGKYNKWHGIYDGEYIDFNMLSNEFKHLVQSGEVAFKNGFSINCFLRIYRSLNEIGEEKVTKYEVIRVNSYFIEQSITETREGRNYRKKKELDNMPNLFTGIEDDF